MSIIRTWTVNIVCSLFQVLLVGFLGIFVFYWGGYILGGIIWLVSGHAQLGLRLGPIVSAGLSVLCYAGGWFGFWWMMYQDGIKRWFYTRVVFGWIPLIVLLCFFRPAPPDPLSMQLVNMPNQFIFSTEVTAIILFPLYSIGLYRYVLQTAIGNKRRNFVRVCLTMVVIGSVVDPIAWHTMQFVYG